MSLDKKLELTTSSENQNDSRILLPSTSSTASDENWRERCVGALDTYKYALEKSLLTDVTFLVGPDSTECHAHRLILALASPVFQAMFYGGLAEKGDSIRIPDVTPEGFQHLLKFIYCEEGPFEDELDAFQTCIAADKYCVSNLKQRCEIYLEVCPINSCNIWGFFENSVFLNAEKVIQRSLNFLRKHIKEAVDHESFLDISPKTVEALLKAKALCIEEYHLILHIGRWAEKKAEEKEVTVYDLLRPMLPLMRFSSLTSSQFVSFLDISSIKNLLTTDDALTILKHLCQPEQCKLPAWCCKEKAHPASPKKESSKDKSAEANKKPSESKKRKKVFEFDVNPKRLHRNCVSPDFSTDSSTSSSSSSSSTSTDFSSNTTFLSDDD